MGSEPIDPEGALLAAALSALFLGLAASAALRRLLRRRAARPGLRAIAATLALSGFVASGALAAVLFLRHGLSAARLPAYAAAGLAAGLAAGTFPLAAGLPLAVLGLTAWMAAALSLYGWSPWTDGLAVAEITVYSSDAGGSLCGLGSPGAGGAAVQRNLRLGPGPIALSLEALELVGPFSFVFGKRYYRLTAVTAGGVASAPLAERPRSLPLRAAAALGPWLGLKRHPVPSPALEPRPLLRAAFILDPVSGLVLKPR